MDHLIDYTQGIECKWYRIKRNKRHINRVTMATRITLLLAAMAMAVSSMPQKFQEVTVATGDTLTLSCHLDNESNNVVIWKKSDRVLFAGNIRVRHDKRVGVSPDSVLTIAPAQPQDQGEYSCEIEDSRGQVAVFSQRVIILQPPVVKISQVGEYLAVKQGTNLALNCVGSGVPVPEVRWRRGSRLLSRGLGEAGVLLEYVTREDAGDLVCEASNGVGEMAQDTLNLDVLHKPEVEMLEPHLSFQPRCGLELQCVVHSSSTPVVQWRQGDLLLHPGPGVTIWSLDNLHVLQLASCDPGILGTFSCRADNNLGQAEASVELSSKWLEESLDTFHRQEEQFNNVRRNVAAEEHQQQSLPLTSSSSRLSCLSISSFLVMLSISLFSMF